MSFTDLTGMLVIRTVDPPLPLFYMTVDPPLPLFYILGDTRISISQETSL